VKVITTALVALFLVGVLSTATVSAQEVDCSDGTAYGQPAPEGGYGTFVFCGGTYEELQTVADCEGSIFWHNTPDGGFIVWIPDSEVEAVNTEWEAFFPDNVIPYGTIIINQC